MNYNNNNVRNQIVPQLIEKPKKTMKFKYLTNQ